MKKVLLVITILVVLLSLTTVVLAAEANADMTIITAFDLMAEFNAGAIKPTNLQISEILDSTGHYMRAMATSDNKHVIAWTLSKEMAPDFDTVVIGFRTNYTDTTSVSGNTQLDFPKDDTFDYKNRYFSELFKRSTLEVVDGKIEGRATYTDLVGKFKDAGVTSLQYIKINPYNGKPFVLEDGEVFSNLYFDIEFIGFFKDIESAERFDYDAYYREITKNFTSYTITYLDRDGKKFTEEKAFDGATVAPIAAPEVKNHKFTGWIYTDGTAVPKSFEVKSDITLKATYVYDEAAYLESVRKETVKNGIKRTDKPFITGYDGFEFRPDNNMTRAEACTVVTRLLVDESTLDNSKTTAFTDLNKNAWYYKYVTYLESIGYLKSYSGEFKPDQKITRADLPLTRPAFAAAIITSYLGCVVGTSLKETTLSPPEILPI